jgi:hypothetical protein
MPRRILAGFHGSDKTIHYLAYLVLVFLLWFAVSPNQKVHWRRPAVWLVLITIVWYGAVDEWLQGYVNRNPDVGDFLANLAGGLTGLIVLTIVPFWPASLALTGAAIFVLRNIVQANFFDLLPVASGAASLVIYGLFSGLWIRNMTGLVPVRAPQAAWLIGALAVPIGLLLGVEMFAGVAGRGVRMWIVAVCIGGIITVVGAVCAFSLIVRGRAGIPDHREL